MDCTRISSLLVLGAFLTLSSIFLPSMSSSSSTSTSVTPADPAAPQHMKSGQTTKNTWYDERIRDRGVIYFYEKNTPFYEFTNFYETKNPLKINGYKWPTTEQYYQAGKITDESLKSLIREGYDSNWADKKPAKKSWGAWAFYIANQSPDVKLKAQVRPDWRKMLSNGMQRNINRMLVALRAKFDQDPALATELLKTYPKVLVEDSPYDGYFGAGNEQGQNPVPQGTGQNILGRMLMHVRKELFRKKNNLPNPERPFDIQNDFTLDFLLSGAKI